MSWRDRAKAAVEKKGRGMAPPKPTKPISVSSVSSTPPPVSNTEDDYTAADLAEMGKLIHEICQLEDRSDEELEALLDERRRMAPVNVKKALAVLRIARDQALAPWPDRPAKRARITLCELTSRRRELVVLDGGETA